MPKKPPTYQQLLKQSMSVRKLPENRPNSSERGYDHRWQKFREYAKKVMPMLCSVCGRLDETPGGMHLDHIKPISQGGERLDINNVRWLCRQHHMQHTAKDGGGFGNPRRGNDDKGRP